MQDFKPYKDPFEDVVMNAFEDFLSFQFVKTRSTFQVHSQFQVVIKLIVWAITSKETFSIKEFVFDPGGLWIY